MGSKPDIDLVFFHGCPNAARARTALEAALRFLELPRAWAEWDLEDPATPDRFRVFGSPTILVDGTDVTGAGPGAAAMACRADGAPSVELILQSLEKAQGSGSRNGRDKEDRRHG